MNQVNIRRAVGQTVVDNTVELVSDVVVVKTKKYPNRSRTCVACHHKCAKVDIVQLNTKQGEFLLEFGEDCLKRFLGKKSKKTSRNTDGYNSRQFTVICSNDDCSNMNLKSRSRFNNVHSTRENSIHWFINPYLCCSCDRITNHKVPLLIERQADIEQNYLTTCKRYGKNINPINNDTFNVIYTNYTASNFNILNISSIMILLDNIKKYPNNAIILHKFILYYISKSRDDDSSYISLQFLPRRLIEWWINEDYNFILYNVLGVKKCLITEDD